MPPFSYRQHKNLYRVDRNRVNFSINVGTVVPRAFNLAPLPAPILSMVPAIAATVVGNDRGRHPGLKPIPHEKGRPCGRPFLRFPPAGYMD